MRSSPAISTSEAKLRNCARLCDVSGAAVVPIIMYDVSRGERPMRLKTKIAAFPAVDPGTVAQDLLPMMQAAKPRPALTFTYQDPPERPRPYYRLVLTFDPANDYGSNSVCAGIPPRFKQNRPGFFYVFAVYCRNDQVLSETTAWTPATAPNDPRIAELFRQLFQVVWSDSPALRPQIGGSDRR